MSCKQEHFSQQMLNYSMQSTNAKSSATYTKWEEYIINPQL
jgi:hypothetical protein